MEIIGELINTSRKSVQAAVADRNASFVIDLAKSQQEAGATYLDINAGTFSGQDEVDALVWLVETVQQDVSVPLCIDSPNAHALRAAVPLCQQTPMINSVTSESARYPEIANLAAEYGTGLIALCMDDAGVPVSAGQRIETARALLDRLETDGVPRDKIYFDPVVQSVGTDPQSGTAVLDAVRAISSEIPESHIVLGMSNISYGLPLRRAINRSFMVLAMGAGADTLILDPTDKPLMTMMAAADALLGRDEFCIRYLQAFRAGRLSI